MREKTFRCSISDLSGSSTSPVHSSVFVWLSCWQLFRPAAQESSLTTAGLVRLPLCNTLTVAQTHRYSNNPQKGEHSLCLPEFTPFLLTNRWSCTCFKHLQSISRKNIFFWGGRHNQPDSLNRGLTCRVWGPPPNSAHRCR